MPRLFAFFAALALSALAVSAACTASASDAVRFTLEPERQDGRIRATFRKADRERSNWSTSFAVADLVGLDTRRLQASGSSPISFAIVREAGRLDCAGTGGHSRAAGSCTFAADVGFTNFLVSRGMRRPTADQAFGLMAVNVRREVVEALSDARYPVPTVDQLMALTAVGVSSSYIKALSRVGYRPATLDNLVEFRALDMTPEFIGGFERIGYRNLRANELVQLRALNVTPEFAVRIQRRRGYQVSVNDLIMLRAVMPERNER